MKEAIEKLVSIGGDPLGAQPPAVKRWFLPILEQHASDLLSMLSRKNGFFALEQALHVLPCAAGVGRIELNAWNATDGWRAAYDTIADGTIVFFAQDLFGCQIGMHRNEVVGFDPETGHVEPKAASLEHWAVAVLEHPNFETGASLAHEWQSTVRPLLPEERLTPRVPFVAGGQFECENLVALDALRALRARAELYRQIKDLPDGAQIEFRIVD